MWLRLFLVIFFHIIKKCSGIEATEKDRQIRGQALVPLRKVPRSRTATTSTVVELEKCCYERYRHKLSLLLLVLVSLDKLRS